MRVTPPAFWRMRLHFTGEELWDSVEDAEPPTAVRSAPATGSDGSGRAIHAGGRAEQGDRLARRDHAGQLVDVFALGGHFFEIAAAVGLPIDGVAVLAVEVGVQLPAGAQVFAPGVPGLVFLAEGPRPITADQQAEAVVASAGSFQRLVLMGMAVLRLAARLGERSSKRSPNFAAKRVTAAARP